MTGLRNGLYADPRPHIPAVSLYEQILAELERLTAEHTPSVRLRGAPGPSPDPRLAGATRVRAGGVAS